MYIRESSLSLKTNILSQLQYIEESANIHRIPVIESNSRYLINLDDILDFAEQTNSSDNGKILSEVCEVNGIDSNKVSFVIQDWRLIEDTSLQELCKGLMDNGVSLFVKPISENDSVSLMMNEYMKNSPYQDFLTEGWQTNLMKMQGLTDEEIKREREYAKVDWHNDDEAYKQLLKDAAGDTSLINKIKELRSQGMKAGDIRSHFSENEKLHPRGRLNKDQMNIYANTKNQAAMAKASGIYETRDRNMKRAGEWLSSKEARNDENAFNAAKQRTQRQLHRAHSHFNFAEKGKFVLDQDPESPTNNADVRYHHFTGATDSEVNNRVSEIEQLVKNEEFPKTRLAKIIAWLRSLYRKFMYKHHIYQVPKDIKHLDLTGNLKNIAARILLLIDKLAQKLQNKLNK